MDILQQDRREATEQRQELCDIITRLQGEVQSSEEYRDKVIRLLIRLYMIHIIFKQLLIVPSGSQSCEINRP